MKKSAMLMLCLVLVFALAACAGTDTTPQGSVSDTVTVTDMKGEVAIPANPQRIVDVAGLTEELLILDMKVIASANTSMFVGCLSPNIWQRFLPKEVLRLSAITPGLLLPET